MSIVCGHVLGPVGAASGRVHDLAERQLPPEHPTEAARRSRVVLDDGAAGVVGPELEPAPERLSHGVADHEHT